MPPVFLLHRSSWLKKGIDHENRTSIEESANFFDHKMQRGDPFLKKIFFLDFDIFMGINLTVPVHWFQNCMKFCCVTSLSGDIGKNMPKNAKIANFMIFGTFWTVFCQYLCLGTLHSKILYRSGISASGRSNWYP